MKTLLSLFGTLTLILATFLSCDTNKRGKLPNDITYNSISVSEVYHLQNDSAKPSCSLKINYIFPTAYSNDEVLGKMQKEFNYVMLEAEKYEKLDPQEAINQYVKDYIENYKRDAIEQFPDWQEVDDDNYFSYYKSLSSSVLFDKGGLVSFQVISIDYKGGINYIPSDFESEDNTRTDAVTAYRNLVINLENGLPVKEEDIFQTDYKEVLTPLLIQKIINNVSNAEDIKVSNTEDLVMMGYWGIEDITSNNNFFVDESGITYIFNPGEFSALSLGEIRVFLPYKELANILKDKSPLSNILDL